MTPLLGSTEMQGKKEKRMEKACWMHFQSWKIVGQCVFSTTSVSCWIANSRRFLGMFPAFNSLSWLLDLTEVQSAKLWNSKVSKMVLQKWRSCCVQKVQNTVQNACSTSAMACREHCILVQQKPDTLVVFTDSVLHQSVWSDEFDSSSCFRHPN